MESMLISNTILHVYQEGKLIDTYFNTIPTDQVSYHLSILIEWCVEERGDGLPLFFEMVLHDSAVTRGLFIMNLDHPFSLYYDNIHRRGDVRYLPGKDWFFSSIMNAIQISQVKDGVVPRSILQRLAPIPGRSDVVEF